MTIERIAEWAAREPEPDGSRIIGLVGPPGCGKTTLCASIVRRLRARGRTAASLSMDDVYASHDARAAQADPRLRDRGPPGTHDIPAAMQVIRDFRAGRPLTLPRFDKSARQGAGDRVADEHVGRADLLFLEGYFVGATPALDVAFDLVGPPISSAADVTFAKESNQRLAQYQTLWDSLDAIWVLRAGDWRWSYDWRLEAEHARRGQGRATLSDAQVRALVDRMFVSVHPDVFYDPIVERAAKLFELDRERGWKG